MQIDLINVSNKTAENFARMTAGKVVKCEYVRTCWSDTCACASHDGGYSLHVLECHPSFGSCFKTEGESVHGHGVTRFVGFDTKPSHEARKEGDNAAYRVYWRRESNLRDCQEGKRLTINARKEKAKAERRKGLVTIPI